MNARLIGILAGEIPIKNLQDNLRGKSQAWLLTECALSQLEGWISGLGYLDCRLITTSKFFTIDLYIVQITAEYAAAAMRTKTISTTRI